MMRLRDLDQLVRKAGPVAEELKWHAVRIFVKILNSKGHEGRDGLGTYVRRERPVDAGR